MTFKADTHQLTALADDLKKAGADVRPEVAKVTGKAMGQIKRDVGRRWRGMPHLKWLPYVTTYDVWTFGAKVTGEVGADHARRQGKLAWVAEFGSPTSAPHPAYRPAADKELPNWEKYLEQVAVKALGDLG